MDWGCRIKVEAGDTRLAVVDGHFELSGPRLSSVQGLIYGVRVSGDDKNVICVLENLYGQGLKPLNEWESGDVEEDGAGTESLLIPD